MRRIRLFASGSMFVFALTMVTQQNGAADNPYSQDGHHQSSAQNGVPAAKEQMKLLTARLDLSRVQQAKIKPILDELHDATVKLVRDQSLSREERMDQMGAWRRKTDKGIREVLNEEQQKKLDQVEHEPHPELHGDVEGR